MGVELNIYYRNKIYEYVVKNREGNILILNFVSKKCSIITEIRHWIFMETIGHQPF